MKNYIVEARAEGRPSLYSMSTRGMAEMDKAHAVRFTQEVAREVAAREKSLRPSYRLIVIKVAS